MELAQIIKWLADTHSHLSLSNPAENAREYNEKHGYLVEYGQYTYALADHFLQMDKTNKEALVRRLFRYGDEFILRLRFTKEDYEADYGKDYKEAPGEWVDYIGEEIYCDNIITHDIHNALFVDMLKFYCEVILLCFESKLDPVGLSPQPHKDIINDLAEFLRLGSRKEDNDDDGDDGKPQRLPRTHRIEAVKLLIQHTGVGKDLDRTQIASFVEAVTGGNISAKPKDTESYKSHSKDAEASAKKWLAKIGITVN